jgi:hypothetical protein
LTPVASSKRQIKTQVNAEVKVRITIQIELHTHFHQGFPDVGLMRQANRDNQETAIEPDLS